MVGKTGGELHKISNISIKIDSFTTSHIQEAHIAIIHYICETLEKYEKNRTIIYVDGASLDQIKKIDPLVKGYTFNPSLFRKLGVKNYLSFFKILSKNKKKSISLEVFADDEKNMIYQAKNLVILEIIFML